MENNIKLVGEMLNKYNISSSDKELFWSIIRPIFKHDEFQKRMDASLYPHHDRVSLGEHIINDAIVTLLIAKKKHVDIKLPIIIAMFHDLYEKPWQNSSIKKNMYVNNHAFTHPLEAIINAIYWYPEYFKDEEKAKIIIDGVIHHMCPFPVRAIDNDIEKIELNNLSKWEMLDEIYKKQIILSSLRNYIKILHLSFSKSLFLEGQIMSKADKKVSLIKDINLNGCMSVLTGKNKKIDSFKK